MDTLEREKELDLLERECCPFKEGDEYWVLNGDGSVSKMEWNNHSIDWSVLMLGNAFRTSKEAILEADRIVLLHRFKMFRDKCNDGWNPNWSGNEEMKAYIQYHEQFNKFVIKYTLNRDILQTFGFFKCKQDAERAIELFGNEIKRLYVEV